MKNFDDLFREASADYAEAPPAAVWQALEKRLDEGKKRRVFPLRWFWYFSIVSFLTLLGASIAWYTTRTATTGDITALNAGASELAVNNNAPSSNTNNTAPTNTSATNNVKHQETTQGRTTQNTTNNTQSTPTTKADTKHAAKQPTPNRSRKHKSRSRTTTTNTYAANTTRDNGSKAVERNGNNGPTVGTSAYSYDDFEEDAPVQNNVETASSAPTSSLGTGYVANKTKKNGMVAVEMIPAPTPTKETTPVRENNGTDELSASMAGNNPVAESKKPLPAKIESGNNDAPMTAHTSRVHNASAIKKVKPTPAAIVSAAPTSKSNAATKPQTIAPAGNSKEIKTETKEVSKATVAAIDNSSRKKAKHTAVTEKTGQVAATNATTPHSKTSKLTTAKVSTQKTQVAATQPVATTIPAQYIAGKEPKPAKSETNSRGQIATGKRVATANKATQKTTEKSVASAQENGKQKKHTPGKQIASSTKSEATTQPVTTVNKKGEATTQPIATADKKAEVTTQPVATVNKKSEAKAAKKKDRKTSTKTVHEYAAATKAETKNTNNPKPTATAQVEGNAKATLIPTLVAQKKQKNPSPKHPAKTTQPVASLKSATSNTAPTTPIQPIVAGKPAARKALTLNEKVTGKKPGNNSTAVAEDEDVITEPAIAAAPEAAKPEEKKPDTKPVATVKKPEEPVVEKAPATDSTKDNEPEAIKRFWVGIKGGYEGGTNNRAANKALLSPYFQYNIGGKFSLMLQPAIKAAFLNKRSIGSPSSYYNVNTGTGNYSLHDSSLLVLPITNDTYWVRNYTYTETHDSIVKSYSIGGTYLEVELPILLQYNITPKLSVYGGINTVYSKLISVKENTYENKGIEATGNPSTIAHLYAPAPTPTETGITYTGNPYSNYGGPLYPAQKGSNFRFGYMLGLSYEIKKRWLADVLLQQTFITPNPQAGYNINSALSMPYVRFTLGYRLTK